MTRAYYYLTKPGIIYGNAITAAAGFFLASKGHIDWFLLIAMLIGLSLIIASSCVFNNTLDRDIDSKMDRTRNRALVTGKISIRNAVIFGIVLGFLGIKILVLYTNFLTLGVALVGSVVYLLLYTPLKRKSIHGTLVGAIAGATPPVVGYTAVTNQLDLGAWLLFFILVAWQMPHFYAIAIRRSDEYAAAHIPVLPLKKGLRIAKINIMIYIVIFIITTILLTVYHYTGYVYLIVMLSLGVFWLWYASLGFHQNIDNKLWARKMFLYSLVVLLVFSLTVSISAII